MHIYAEYIQYICSAIESEVVEALAMFRLAACGACGCLMRPGARLPNAQQSVAQATTAGLALYNCSYTCTYVHTCIQLWTQLDQPLCSHKCTMLLEYNAQNLGRLESRPMQVFFAQFFVQLHLVKIRFHNYTLYAMYSYMNMISGSFYRRITFMMWWCAINYEVFTQSLGKQQHVHIT